MKNISIVVACRNEENNIVNLLKSIEKSDYDIGKIEVIIVDGLSTDNTISEIKSYQSHSELAIVLLENKKQKTPYAFNIGIKKSMSNIVVIAGARFVFSPNYFTVIEEVLNNNKEIGCVGGRIVNIYENKTSEIISQAMASTFGIGFGNFRTVVEDKFVDTVTPPAFRKEIFNEIGYFDERLTRNQDDDFSYRVIKAGYKILLKENISFQYVVRASFGKLYKQYKQYGYWKVFVNKKHKTVTTLRQVFPSLFLLSLIVLPILGLVFPIFFILLAVELFLYFTLNFIFAFNDNKFNFIKLLKQMYTCTLLHCSYGMGYLEGVVDFLILNRTPNSKNEELSR